MASSGTCLRLLSGLGLVLLLAGVRQAAAVDESAERIGSETCGVCHDEVFSAFRTSIHYKTDPEGSCENCHGPGSAHVEEGNPAAIRRFDADVAHDTRRGACLECHERGRQTAFARSEHGLASLACDSCHSSHRPTTDPLLKHESPGLCYDCHAPVRAQFALGEHHPVDEGGVSCSDCHDPHAPQKRSLLGGFKQETCLECHGEYRGPWFFEHEAVTVEGCTACHTPHGSVNRHLLTYQVVGDLCLQCHPEQPFFHDLTDVSGERTTGFNDCTRCHAQIHGSNNDALFLN